MISRNVNPSVTDASNNIVKNNNDTFRLATCMAFFGFDVKYEGWNFNSGNYLFTTDTK